MQVGVSLSYAADPANPQQRLGLLKVTSSSGALDALLASQSSVISRDLGFSLPPASASAASRSSAELVYDTAYGLRLLNVSLAPGITLGLSDLSRRIGFTWQGSSSDGTELIAFSAAQLYYVPARPGAPALVWNGQVLQGGELGVSCLVDIPALSISGMRAALLVRAGGRLTVVVSEGLHGRQARDTFL